MAIQSFADDLMRDLLAGIAPDAAMPAGLARIVRRKLVMLDCATCLDDLADAPANQLEPYGQGGEHFSLRVDAEHRMTFAWTEVGPAEV